VTESQTDPVADIENLFLLIPAGILTPETNSVNGGNGKMVGVGRIELEKCLEWHFEYMTAELSAVLRAALGGEPD